MSTEAREKRFGLYGCSFHRKHDFFEIPHTCVILVETESNYRKFLQRFAGKPVDNNALLLFPLYTHACNIICFHSKYDLGGVGIIQMFHIQHLLLNGFFVTEQRLVEIWIRSWVRENLKLLTIFLNR